MHQLSKTKKTQYTRFLTNMFRLPFVKSLVSFSACEGRIHDAVHAEAIRSALSDVASSSKNNPNSLAGHHLRMKLMSWTKMMQV